MEGSKKNRKKSPGFRKFRFKNKIAWFPVIGYIKNGPGDRPLTLPDGRVDKKAPKDQET
jgi:hypothetical protein